MIYIASDHAGFQLKKSIITLLSSETLKFEDCGCDSETSCHYPEFGEKVARLCVKNKVQGILICGTGIGMGIAANKVSGARAAMVNDVTAARLSRAHNNANIVCLGARLVGIEVALDIIRTFLSTAFEGGRHQLRVDLLEKIEAKR